MYFKVDKNSELGKEILAMHEKMQWASDQLLAFAKSISDLPKPKVYG